MGTIQRTDPEFIVALGRSVSPVDDYVIVSTANGDGAPEHVLMRFRVVGESPNIQLVRLNTDGKAMTARPSSAEEMYLYRAAVRMLKSEQALKEELRALEVKLQSGLAWAPELAEQHPSDRMDWLNEELTIWTNPQRSSHNGR